MHKITSLGLGLLSLLVSSATPAMAAATKRGGAELLNPKAYAISTSFTSFQTSSYFDVEGSEIELPEGYAYKLSDIDFGVSYGFSKTFEISAIGKFRMVSSTMNDFETKKSGLESVSAVVKYGFPPSGAAHYALAAHYGQTLYSNASYDDTLQLPADELILGDAGSEYGVDLLWTYSGKPLKWDGKLGYNSPANNLSAEIVYKLETMYQFTELNLFAGVEGIHSLKKDEFTEDPTLKPVQSTGSTLLFNSVNREKIAPYIGANYGFDKVLITLKGQTVMKGKYTDKGNSLFLGLTWNTSGVTSEEIKINSFKEYQVDGSVLKISARGNFLRIDQGLSTDVEKGMRFDIYQTDYFGGNVLVASGIVYEVGTDWSVIKLLKKYKDIQIKPGFAARGY
jgi:hypothetical protein